MGGGFESAQLMMAMAIGLGAFGAHGLKELSKRTDAFYLGKSGLLPSYSRLWTTTTVGLLCVKPKSYRLAKPNGSQHGIPSRHDSLLRKPVC